MHVVTVMNPKGGVGKSTAVHQLSAALTLAHGLRVLVVDATPQASLTGGWLGEGTAALDSGRTAAAILGGLSPPPAQVIRATGIPGLSLIPGLHDIRCHDGADPERCEPGVRERLRDFLREVEGSFDIVMIDTPPGFPGGIAHAALAASDWILTPVLPDAHGTQGLVDVLEFLDAVWSQGYAPEFLGFLISQIKSRFPLHRGYEARLRAHYGDCVFATTFPDRSEFCEAVSYARLIQRYRFNGAASRVVKAISNELVSRMLKGKVGGRHRGLPLDEIVRFDPCPVGATPARARPESDCRAA